jgi:hypothetical protein
MDAIIGLFSLIGFLVGLVWLFIRLVKRKSKRQPIIILLICFVLLIIVSNKPDNLNDYEWGTVVSDKLQEIGVKDVKSIEAKDQIYVNQIIGSDVSIETEKTKLEVSLHSNFKGFDEKGKALYEWSIWSISDASDKDKVYYDYYEETYGEGKPAFNLYDYRTGDILISADPKEIAKREELGRENLARIQDRLKEEKIQEDEKSKVIIAEIYEAYKSNQLVADDKYKGTRYTITGVFETVKDDGLVNTLFKEIGVVVSVKVDNLKLYLLCKFDDSERESLKKFSSSDTIKFSGECISWGNWTNCKVE